MIEAERNLLLFGQAGPLPEQIQLEAGPVGLIFEEGSIRSLTLGGREILRRVYAAVRDKEWRTVPGVVRDLKIDRRRDSFEVHFRSFHDAWGILYEWNGRITGASDGTIVFWFDGIAKSGFERNRIGFCVLHQPSALIDHPCRVEYVDGAIATPRASLVIATEQPIPGFKNLKSLAYAPAPDVWVTTRFEGDIFETEDQRNWIDDSFKTYCTPNSDPIPVRVAPGDRVQQKITISISSANIPPAPPATGPVKLRLQSDTKALPKIGFGANSAGATLSFLEAGRLQQLRPAHLRVDLQMNDPEWPEALGARMREAFALKCKAELALRLTGCPGEDLRDLITTFPEPFQHWSYSQSFARILVSTFGEMSTSKRSLDAVRAFLASSGLASRDVPVGAGTEGDLFQLNLQRPPREADCFFWSMNPQVHTFDIGSMAETPEGALWQAWSVGHYFGDAPKIVSPITLRPRSVLFPGKDEIESRTDLRQKSLFGASWTIAMLDALTKGEADAATFFETIGPLGLMESGEGRVCPTYHVFRAIAGATRAHCAGQEPERRVAVFGVKTTEGIRLLIGNYTRDEMPITLRLHGNATARKLNADSAESACKDPERFWNEPGVPFGGSSKLAPFEIVFVDAAGAEFQ